MRNENSPSLEYISMFLVAAAIISVMFWIKGEVEWAEFKKKNHRPNETYKSSKSSFADTLGLIASIITIIGAIIYVVKVIS
ncbi:hypothetical protein GM418_10810 [Maribellus comscasis]|uniref:Uncharacterized protein n=1 Tax=Maribellus comscasis TaxID=2681766 RepID=A0A6I6JSP8_9BACT|nr:hypothetical protein [Maribellus comscasis]QGY44130.1 hypothetical protein GM418_10810 [Maribellus comscasis]